MWSSINLLQVPHPSVSPRRVLKVRNIVDLKLNLFRMESSSVIMSEPSPSASSKFKLGHEMQRQRNRLVKSIKILLVGSGIWEK